MGDPVFGIPGIVGERIVGTTGIGMVKVGGCGRQKRVQNRGRKRTIDGT